MTCMDVASDTDGLLPISLERTLFSAAVLRCCSHAVGAKQAPWHFFH